MEFGLTEAESTMDTEYDVPVAGSGVAAFEVSSRISIILERFMLMQLDLGRAICRWCACAKDA